MADEEASLVMTPGAGGGTGLAPVPTRPADVLLVPPPSGALATSERRSGPAIEAMVVAATYGLPWIAVPDGLELWTRFFVGITCVLGANLALDAWRNRRARPFQHAALVGDVRTSAPGTRVRVQGRVLEGPTFECARTKRRVVLAAYAGRVERPNGALPPWRARLDVHAIPFRVLLDSRQTLRVDAPPAPIPVELRTSRNPTADRPLHRRTAHTADGRAVVCAIEDELLIGPGDVVELVGTIEQAPDPEAERAGPREMPLAPLMRGSSGRPVLIRLAR